MEEIIRTTISTTIEEVIQNSNLFCFDIITLAVSIIAILISIWSVVWTVRKGSKQDYNNSLYEDVLQKNLNSVMPKLIHKSIDIKSKCVNEEEINKFETFINKLRENILVFKYINEQFEEQEVSFSQIAKIIEETIHFPVFVKPSNSGSSVGIHKVNDEKELEKALLDASNYDNKILLEEEIIGREVECAVLGNEEIKATCVGEVLSAEDFYTFEAKYQNTASRTIIPAEISEEKQREIQTLAIKAFKSVDGKGLSRVDFFIRKSDNQVCINEINTMPGFTQISMYPKLWEASGLSYTKLLDKLIELAY